MSENYLIIYLEAMQQSSAVISLGGMCFVRKWCVDMIGKDKVGPSGPFDYTATTPEIVRHILTDDFSEFLNLLYFWRKIQEGVLHYILFLHQVKGNKKIRTGNAGLPLGDGII